MAVARRAHAEADDQSITWEEEWRKKRCTKEANETPLTKEIEKDLKKTLKVETIFHEKGQTRWNDRIRGGIFTTVSILT